MQLYNGPPFPLILNGWPKCYIVFVKCGLLSLEHYQCNSKYSYHIGMTITASLHRYSFDEDLCVGCCLLWLHSLSIKKKHESRNYCCWRLRLLTDDDLCVCLSLFTTTTTTTNSLSRNFIIIVARRRQGRIHLRKTNFTPYIYLIEERKSYCYWILYSYIFLHSIF